MKELGSGKKRPQHSIGDLFPDVPTDTDRLSLPGKWTSTHARARTHTHTYIHTYIHTFIHTYKHIYIHTIHKNIHSYIYTYYTYITYIYTFIYWEGGINDFLKGGIQEWGIISKGGNK